MVEWENSRDRSWENVLPQENNEITYAPFQGTCTWLTEISTVVNGRMESAMAKERTFTGF